MQAPNGKSVPSRARGNAGTVARDLAHARRRFATVQVAKAALGAMLWLAFVALVGKPDLMETVALAGFLAPCVLAHPRARRSAVTRRWREC